MDIIQGLISEEDIMYMSDDTLISLGNLLDDNLGTIFNDYLEDPKGTGIVKDRIRKFIGEKVKRSVFHKEVLARGIVEEVNKISIEALPISSADYTTLKKSLLWLKENKQYLKSYIEPRQESDFKDFLAGIHSMSNPNGRRNLPALIAKNAPLFYSRYEKPRSTRIGSLVERSDNWEIILYGLHYLEYCNKLGLPSTSWIRRTF